jgi:oligogalacturonide lyase
VAKAKDGRWIYLFRPEAITFQGEFNQKDFVQPGVFRAEKLVNMAKHNYRLEPNVSFTPDQKGWYSAPTCSAIRMCLAWK